jgi:2,4-dienoyl-CoA reductase-like NADH-dependent reductase (Old Yellow Enzyme family)
MRAAGGTGLIVVEATCICPEGRLAPSQLGLWEERQIQGHAAIADACHRYGAVALVQLHHGGYNTHPECGVSRGPSVVEWPYFGGTKMTEAFTHDEIVMMRDTFIEAAVRAKKAGFDGVQLHVAHGYLLSRFLTPYYNRRTDEYGGSTENRARAVVEICQGIREAVSADYPVLAKINGDDFMNEQGLTFEECQTVCKLLQKAGLSAIEISGGTSLSRVGEGTIQRVTPETESYFMPYAAKIADELEIPVISVGGHRDIQKLTDIVKQTKIQYISLCRPFIREPNLTQRWADGDRAPAKCVSCTKCFGIETQCVFTK